MEIEHSSTLIIILIVFSSLVLLMASDSKVKSTDVEIKTWTCSRGLVSIDYPASWEAIDNFENVVDIIF